MKFLKSVVMQKKSPPCTLELFFPFYVLYFSLLILRIREENLSADRRGNVLMLEFCVKRSKSLGTHLLKHMWTQRERETILFTSRQKLNNITGKHPPIAQRLFVSFRLYILNFILSRWAWRLPLSPYSTTCFSLSNNPT